VKAQLESIVGQMYHAGMRFDEAVREFQKTFVLIVLRQERGNQCKAADKLGMHRNTLHRTIAGLQIDVNSIRQAKRRISPRVLSPASSRSGSPVLVFESRVLAS
jgi:Fis family transcriptional regulator